VSAGASRWIGPAFAVAGVLGFSFKAILIKLAYAWSSVDATTLLALRMLYSAPFFIAMAWWSGRGAVPIGRADWRTLVWLGFVGYYCAGPDFSGHGFGVKSWLENGVGNVEQEGWKWGCAGLAGRSA
jgi:hypothetical protein